MDAAAIVRAVLAADCACVAEAFDAAGVTVVPWEARAGRRRYPLDGHVLQVVTMGRGTVVSVDAGRLATVRHRVSGLGPQELFSPGVMAALPREGEALRGPHTGWVCTAQDLRPVTPGMPVRFQMLYGEGIGALYSHADFGNALGYGRAPDRPDTVACVATGAAGQILGIAGASADSDAMWQVGVDVVPAMRGHGLGTALVAAVTEAVLRAGRLPFYTTAPGNLASMRVAARTGYRPRWVQWHARVITGLR